MNQPSTATTPPLLLNAAQVAELLGITAWSVRNLHRCDLLPGVIVLRKLRFRRTDIEMYVERLVS